MYILLWDIVFVAQRLREHTTERKIKFALYLPIFYLQYSKFFYFPLYPTYCNFSPSKINNVPPVSNKYRISNIRGLLIIFIAYLCEFTSPSYLSCRLLHYSCLRGCLETMFARLQRPTGQFVGRH